MGDYLEPKVDTSKQQKKAVSQSPGKAEIAL